MTNMSAIECNGRVCSGIACNPFWLFCERGEWGLGQASAATTARSPIPHFNVSPHRPTSPSDLLTILFFFEIPGHQGVSTCCRQDRLRPELFKWIWETCLGRRAHMSIRHWLAGSPPTSLSIQPTRSPPSNPVEKIKITPWIHDAEKKCGLRVDDVVHC